MQIVKHVGYKKIRNGAYFFADEYGIKVKISDGFGLARYKGLWLV
nr:hypothetical protein [Helicobacter pylori]